MKVAIIGCGLIGVTTAHFLRQRGHDVTVLERAEGPARETSFANGGMLTPGMCQPWNEPGSGRILLRSLVRSDTALQLRLSTLPRLARWGASFLKNSTVAAFERCIHWRSCVSCARTLRSSLVVHRLTVPELIALEPALQPIAHKLSGAIHYLSDEVGDAQIFG